MQVEVYKTAAKIDVNDAAFAREFNEDLVHQLVTAHQAGARQGTHQQKTRSMVRGGGKKPWRQKGTGRARAGTSRSPLWRSGGIIFAKVPRDYSKLLNRKMRKAAMQCIISQLLRENRLIVVEDTLADIKEPKVKSFLKSFGELVGDKVTLLVTENPVTNLVLGSRNIPKILLGEISSLSPVHLVRAEQVVMTTSALKALQASWE